MYISYIGPGKRPWTDRQTIFFQIFFRLILPRSFCTQGWGGPFPMKKVMSVKTVGRYACCHVDFHDRHEDEPMHTCGLSAMFSLIYDYTSIHTYLQS